MVYGPTEEPKDEEAKLEPVNAYGRSRSWRKVFIAYGKKRASRKRRLTIVRPGVIYGLTERGNFTQLAEALRQRRFAYPGPDRYHQSLWICGRLGVIYVRGQRTK